MFRSVLCPSGFGPFGAQVPGFDGFRADLGFCMVEMFRPKNVNFTDAVAED